jgi:hypothetical protein
MAPVALLALAACAFSPHPGGISGYASPVLSAACRSNRPCIVPRASRLPLASVAASKQQRQPRGRKRETLLAKGAAGALLVRVAYQSQTAAICAATAGIVVATSPVIAVEAMLLAALLVVFGAAKYWPTNFLAMILGVAGAAGALNDAIMRWERMSARRAAKRAQRSQKRRPPLFFIRRRRERRTLEREAERNDARVELRDDDDGSAGLVALLFGAIAAGIFGALP